jgi:hypothetical protein
MSITADWQFIDAAKLVVLRALPDGSQESALASREDVSEWLDANPNPGVLTPSAPVPQQVTMRQARLALLAVGKLSAVSAAIAAMPSPQKETALIEWDYSSTVERDSAVVALLGPALNLDSAALDALFTTAAQL